MEDWKLEIQKVQNGYILTGKFGDTDMISKKVIEEGGEEAIWAQDAYCYDQDLNAIKNLLYEVMEYFGVHYSKHNVRNVEINVVENKERC